MNTMVIKARALVLKLSRGSYPFDYFKDKTPNSSPTEFSIQYQTNYHSLSYLNYQKALELHAAPRSITQELIIGLVFYNELINDKKLDQNFLIDLALALKEKSIITKNGMVFYFTETNSRFDLEGKYYSGIVQGKAASLFLRCYEITNHEKFKHWAYACLVAAWVSVEEGGTLRKLNEGQIWIEEYPSPKPSMVLNGFIFYIIGMAEYLSFVDDEKLKSQLELCLNSLIAWLPNYKLKNGLLYSMYRWNLCNVHYTGIMKYQFEHLYTLTGNSIFKEYSEFTHRLTDWDTFGRII